MYTQNISEKFLNVAVKAVDEQVREFMVRDHSLFCPEETLFGRKNIILKLIFFNCKATLQLYSTFVFLAVGRK